MGWWSRLFGSKSLQEVPWEPLEPDEVQRRAGSAVPAVAGVSPAFHHGRILELVAANPTDAKAQLGLAAVLLCEGDYDEGLRVVNQAIFHETDPLRIAFASRIKATTLDLFQDQPDAAMEHYDACVALAPRYLEAKPYLAEIAYRNGDTRKLQKLFAQTLTAGLTGPLAEADAALHSDDHEGAVEALHVAHRVSLLETIARSGSFR